VTKLILRYIAGNWKHLKGFVIAFALLVFTLYAIVHDANLPKKYILAHGTYHSTTTFDCDFGYVTDWVGVAKLDIDGNKIPCENVTLRPAEMRRLSGS